MADWPLLPAVCAAGNAQQQAGLRSSASSQEHGCSQTASSALSRLATPCLAPVGAGVGGRVPTWRMVPGSSTESLALDVALQCGVPLPVVQRAAELWKVGGSAYSGRVVCSPMQVWNTAVHTCHPAGSRAVRGGMACTVLGRRSVYTSTRRALFAAPWLHTMWNCSRPVWHGLHFGAVMISSVCLSNLLCAQPVCLLQAGLPMSTGWTSSSNGGKPSPQWQLQQIEDVSAVSVLHLANCSTAS